MRAAVVIPAHVLDEAIEGLFTDVTVIPNYSGRYMYGGTCFGIVVDDGSPSVLAEFFINLHRIAPQIAEALAPETTTDSMGLGTIFYWPNCHVAGDSSHQENDV